MKRIIVLLVKGIIISTFLIAQSPEEEFTDQMNHIFKLVDKSMIKTGLLSDYGLQMIEPSYFNGIPADSNYVDLNTWKMLYTGIYTSKINNNISLILPETVFNQIENTTHSGSVPVTMMHYQYNALNEDALTMGLLQIVNNDQLKEVSGAASPYTTQQLFAVAPKKLLFNNLTVSFVFNSNLWYKNVNKTVQKLEINFNNQSGYLLANWNTPVSYTFDTEGVKTIYFKLTYTDGSSYTSQTNIIVYDPILELKISDPKYEPDIEIFIQRNSQHSGGKMQIKYSTYNQSNQIKKPLIVAEGFDPSSVVLSMDNNDIRTFLKTKLDKVESPINNNKTLYDEIDLALYDIIYLDYNDGVDDIRRNAQLFKEVIGRVNQLKVGDELNIVMGLSMGGLVARIALSELEQQTNPYNHQTKKYISVDSPHKGANLPVGFQAAVRHIQQTDFVLLLPTLQIIYLNYSIIEMANYAVNLLNSEAAKQMLIYNLNYLYNINNSVHNSFQTYYDNLVFPQGFSNQPIENIAISNGSNNGSWKFLPGSYIIDLRYKYDFKWWMDLLSSSPLALKTLYLLLANTNYSHLILNSIPGHSQFIADIKINALTSQNNRIYLGNVYINKKVLFLIPVVIPITMRSVNSGSGLLPLDGAPGGLFGKSAFGDDIQIPEELLKQTDFCFIPTGSSLAHSNWTNLTQNFTSPSPNTFNSIFSQNDNEPHVNFKSSSMFLYKKLINITGPAELCITGNYTLDPPQNSVVWSVTGAFNVSPTTGNSVTVTRTGSGTGILTAKVGNKIIEEKVILQCPSSISGPNNVCHSGQYTLNDPPPNTIIHWSVTGPFYISNINSNPVTVQKTGSGNTNGILTARINNSTGQILAEKTITPFQSYTFQNQIVTGNFSVANYCDIFINNVTVKNNVSLDVWTNSGDVIIEGEFKIESGSGLNIYKMGN